LLVAALATVRAGRLGFLSPFVLFMGGGVLYILPVALTLLFDGVLTWERKFNTTVLIDAIWLSVAALVAATFGFVIGMSDRRRPRPFPQVFSRWNPVAVSVVGWGLIIYGILTVSIAIILVGGPAVLTDSQYGHRYLLLRGLGPLLSGLTAVIIGGSILFLSGLRRGRPRTTIAVAVLVLGALAVWTMILESRSALVQMMLVFLIIRHTSGRRLRALGIVAIAVLLLTGGMLFGYARGAAAHLGDLPFWVFNPANHEFGAAIGTVADIIHHVPAAIDYRYGLTYLSAPGVLVPLFLWPGRPLAPGEWYVATLYPNVWMSGGAYAFSPVAEAYLNFGIGGVLIVFCLLGIAIARLERRLALYDVLPPWVSIAYALFAPYIILFSRLDSVTVLKSFVVLTLFPMLLSAATTRILVQAAGGRSLNSRPVA